MTMPHLMNCDHSSDGWCLACVKQMHDQREQYETALEAIAKRLEPVRHDRTYKAVGLLELPARVGMLAAEVQQLRQAVRRAGRQ